MGREGGLHQASCYPVTYSRPTFIVTKIMHEGDVQPQCQKTEETPNPYLQKLVQDLSSLEKYQLREAEKCRGWGRLGESYKFGFQFETTVKSIYQVSANGWDANFLSSDSCHKPWKGTSSGYPAFLQGCEFVVGGGDRVRFCEDDWCRGGVLKEVFPRLFILSSKQHSSISSVVSSGAYPQNWDFGLRRHLTVWEIDEVTRLLVILNGVRLIPSRRDNRCKLDHSGLYSCHSFRSFIQDNGSAEKFPPYPQIPVILLWQVAIGKVNTSDTLQRHRPFMCLSPLVHSLHMDRESTDHLFIHCSYTLKVWWLLLREVNAAWVIPKGCFQLLSYKIDALGRGKKAKVLWGCLVHAVFGNLWLERNRRIF
ncbi:PREDICTED: Reverse mRNAase zinc-binding domain [Prunus dulcis]|uniref:PREDICTED: Reverse mRNAase zinc-binding domain n=1 Tax=Prunus dulcis TaxID=3755 RepID=A0A5E4GHK9_PRUDU|nr:PREDICTED: Reverse mRNAase zinc-binding domain [Prunus dulcis]